MSTKTTLGLLRTMGAIMFLLIVLGSRTSNPALIIAGFACVLLYAGLFCYAWFREKELGDKSESISPRTLSYLFCAMGIGIVVLVVRVFMR